MSILLKPLCETGSYGREIGVRGYAQGMPNGRTAVALVRYNKVS